MTESAPLMALGGISGGPDQFPYWHTWGSLIAAIGHSDLPYLGPDVSTFDATAGRAVFWRRWRPDELVLNDIDPNRDADMRWDWYSEPVPADLVGRFGAAVIDPGFKLSGRNDIMLDRYGLDGDDPNLARMAQLMVGAFATGETVRPGGYLLVKCQPQVAGARLHDQPRRVTNELEAHGWEHVDTFIRQYRPVPQPPRTRSDGKPVRQGHARRNYSELTVLQKTVPEG